MPPKNKVPPKEEATTKSGLSIEERLNEQKGAAPGHVDPTPTTPAADGDSAAPAATAASAPPAAAASEPALQKLTVSSFDFKAKFVVRTAKPVDALAMAVKRGDKGEPQTLHFRPVAGEMVDHFWCAEVPVKRGEKLYYRATATLIGGEVKQNRYSTTSAMHDYGFVKEPLIVVYIPDHFDSTVMKNTTTDATPEVLGELARVAVRCMAPEITATKDITKAFVTALNALLPGPIRVHLLSVARMLSADFKDKFPSPSSVVAETLAIFSRLKREANFDKKIVYTFVLELVSRTGLDPNLSPFEVAADIIRTSSLREEASNLAARLSAVIEREVAEDRAAGSEQPKRFYQLLQFALRWEQGHRDPIDKLQLTAAELHELETFMPKVYNIVHLKTITSVAKFREVRLTNKDLSVDVLVENLVEMRDRPRAFVEDNVVGLHKLLIAEPTLRLLRFWLEDRQFSVDSLWRFAAVERIGDLQQRADFVAWAILRVSVQICDKTTTWPHVLKSALERVSTVTRLLPSGSNDESRIISKHQARLKLFELGLLDGDNAKTVDGMSALALPGAADPLFDMRVKVSMMLSSELPPELGFFTAYMTHERRQIEPLLRDKLDIDRLGYWCEQLLRSTRYSADSYAGILRDGLARHSTALLMKLGSSITDEIRALFKPLLSSSVPDESLCLRVGVLLTRSDERRQFAKFVDLYTMLIGKVPSEASHPALAKLVQMRDALERSVAHIVGEAEAQRLTFAQLRTMNTLGVLQSAAEVGSSAGSKRLQRLFDDAKRKYDSAVGELHTQIATLSDRFARLPPFKAATESKLRDVRKQLEEIDSLPVSQLNSTRPSFTVMTAFAEELHKLEESATFRDAWKRVEHNAEPLAPDVDNEAFCNAANELVARARDAHQQLWSAIGKKDVLLGDVLRVARRVCEERPTVARRHAAQPDELHEDFNRDLKRYAERCRDQLAAETRAVMSIAPGALSESVEATVGFISECMELRRAQQQFAALASLAQQLGTPLDATFAELRDAFVATAVDDEAPAEGAVKLLRTLRQLLPDLDRCVDDFIEMFNGVVRDGLISSIKGDADVTMLSATVQRRLESIQDDQHSEILIAYQTVVETLAKADEDFKELCRTKARSVRQLAAYMARVSGCAPQLAQLRGNVKLLATIRKDDDEEQAIVIANRLLRRGEFLVGFDDENRPRVVARLASSESATATAASTQYTWQQLCDFGGQLMLAARVDVDDDDTVEREAPASPTATSVVNESAFGIRTGAQRKRLIQLYDDLCDGLRELLTSFGEFGTSGHPRHRSDRCSITLAIDNNIDQVLVALSNVCVEVRRMAAWWLEFLPKQRAMMPLLCFMPRILLADCVVHLINRDHEAFERCIAQLLLTNEGQQLQTMPADEFHAKLAGGSQDDNVGGGGGGGRSRRRVEAPDDVSKAAIDDERFYKSCCQVIKEYLDRNLHSSLRPRLPAAVRAADRDVGFPLSHPYTIVRLQADHGDHILAAMTSIYVVELRRFPCAFEVFLCTTETSVADVDDFVARWRVNHKRPFKGNDLLFAICNAELLASEVVHNLAAHLREAETKATDEATRLIALCAGDCLLSKTLGARVRNLSDIEGLLHKSERAFGELHMRTVESHEPLQGKTRAVLDRVVAERVLYAMLPVAKSSTFDGLAALLTSLFADVEHEGGARTLLHVDVSFDADPTFVARFMFALVVLRSVTDSGGRIVKLPHSVDVVAELASDPCGCRVAFLERFTKLQISSQIATTRFDVEPLPHRTSTCDVSLLCKVSEHHDGDLELGAKVIVNFHSARGGEMSLADGTALRAQPRPTPAQVTAAATALTRSPANANVANVFRFFAFAATQSAFLLSTGGESTFSDIMKGFDAESKHHEVGFHMMLFHYVEMIVEAANNMASVAMAPRGAETEGDDTRFNKMRKFREWREDPMLVVNKTGQFRLFSLRDGQTVFESFVARNTNPSFRGFLQIQNGIPQISRTMLAAKCANVTSDAATLDDDEDPLRLVLGICSTRHDLSRTVFGTLTRIGRLKDSGKISARNPVSSLDGEFGDAIPLCLALLEQAKVADTGRDMPISAFTDGLEKWARSIFGSTSSSSRPPFVLTVDLLVRIAAMKLRAVCGIPVVWVGESGCGKTHAVEAFCRASAAGCHVININGSMSAHDLLRELQPAIREALSKPLHRIVVQLDEFNTLKDMWCIKQLLVDRTILGRRMPANISFVGIMNPIRFRTDAQLKALEKVDRLGGLNYETFDESAARDAVSEASKRLVYQVNRCPDSVMALAWDFGSCVDNESESALIDKNNGGRTTLRALGDRVTDELLFAENILNWMTVNDLCRESFSAGGVTYSLKQDFSAAGDRDGVRTLVAYRTVVVAMLDASQRFLRDEFAGEPSVVSLRDMRRVVTLIPFFMRCYVERARCDGNPLHDAMPFFAFLTRSTAGAFVLVYCLRLDAKRRVDYLKRLLTVWTSVRMSSFPGVHPLFLAPPADAFQVYRDGFDTLAADVCSCLPDNDGLALNEAMKENVLSMFASFMTDQALMIVGRAGSSKSRSKDSLINATDPYVHNERCAFFKRFKVKLQRFVLQCSRHTTADDVLRVAQNAARQQIKHGRELKCILVLEEVGVTIGSRHNPLMMLHTLLDHGVPLIVDGEATRVKIPILGISNWVLDSSKMNRAITAHRGNPPVEDLIRTAKEIAANSPSFPRGIDEFARVFSSRVLSGDFAHFTWFHGMRDFYSFVTTLTSIAESGTDATVTALGGDAPVVNSHAIRWALRISFGGMPREHANDEAELLKAMREAYEGAGVPRRSEARYNVRVSGSSSEGGASATLRLCEHCAGMYFRRHWQQRVARDPTQRQQEGELDADFARRRREYFESIAERNQLGSMCEWFDDTRGDEARSGCDVEVMSYSITNPNARHLLVFSKDGYAVQLLQSLGLIERDSERTTIIFGSSGRALSQATRVADLSKVKSRLRRGGTLLLINAGHLYEALLDPLNMSYSVEGTGDSAVYRTRLPTADGYSQSVRVDPSFRCVIVSEERHAHMLLPPFLNRFTKARISYSQVLPQRLLSVKRELEASAVVAYGEPRVERSLFDLAIPGFGEETLASALMLVDAERQQPQDTEPADGSGAPKRPDLKAAATQLLGTCFSPRVMAMLRRELGGKLGNDAVLDQWEQVLHDDTARRTHQLDVDVVNAWVARQHCANFFVLTEQQGINFAECAEQLKAMIETGYRDEKPQPEVDLVKVTATLSVLDVNGAGADVTAARMLRELMGSTPGPNTVRLAVFFADASAAVSGLSRLLYSVESRAQPERTHVAVVLYSPDALSTQRATPAAAVAAQASAAAKAAAAAAAAAGSRFALTFVPKWLAVFIDEVSPSLPHTPVRFRDFYAESLLADELRAAAIARKVLLQNVATITQFAVASMSSAAEASRAAQTVEKFVASRAFDAVALRCVEMLQCIPQLRDGSWRDVAMSHLSAASSSLRQVVNSFLEQLWLRVAVKIFSVLPPSLIEKWLLGGSAHQTELATRVVHRVLMERMGDLSHVIHVNLPLAPPPPCSSANAVDTAAAAFAGAEGSKKLLMFPFAVIVAGILHVPAELTLATRRELHERAIPAFFNDEHFSDDERFEYAVDVLLMARPFPRRDAAVAALRLLHAMSSDGDRSLSVVRAVDLAHHAVASEGHMLDALCGLLTPPDTANHLVELVNATVARDGHRPFVFAHQARDALLRIPLKSAVLFAQVKAVVSRLPTPAEVDEGVVDDESATSLPIDWALEQCSLQADGDVHNVVVLARQDAAVALHHAARLAPGSAAKRMLFSALLPRAKCDVYVLLGIAESLRDPDHLQDRDASLKQLLYRFAFQQWLAENRTTKLRVADASHFEHLATAAYRVLLLPANGVDVLVELLSHEVFDAALLPACDDGDRMDFHRACCVAAVSAATTIIANAVKDAAPRPILDVDCISVVLGDDDANRLRAAIDGALVVGRNDSGGADLNALRGELAAEAALLFLRQVTSRGVEVDGAAKRLEGCARRLPEAFARAPCVRQFIEMHLRPETAQSSPLECIEGWRTCTDAVVTAADDVVAVLGKQPVMASFAALRRLAVRQTEQHGNNCATYAGTVLQRQEALRTIVRLCGIGGGAVAIKFRDAPALDELVTHAIAAFVTAADPQTVLGYFGALVQQPHNPAVTLPTVTDSAEHDFAVAAAATGSTYLYRCPNGHLYSTGECQHINSTGRCPYPRCGALIGGIRYNQLHPGNVQLGAIGTFVANPALLKRTTGYATSAGDGVVALPRGLTPPAYHACRVFLLIALLHSVQLAPANHTHNAEQYTNDLRAAVTALRQALFPAVAADEPVLEWLHALLLMFRTDARFAAATAPCTDRSAVERLFMATVTSPADAAALLTSFREKRQSNLDAENVVMSAVRWDARHEARLAALDDSNARLQRERRFMRFRTTFNFQAFTATALANRPVSAALLRYGRSLSGTNAGAMLAMLRFLGSLTAAAAEQQLTLETARSTTIGAFMAEADNENFCLEEHFRDFKAVAVAHTLNKIDRMRCTTLRPEANENGEPVGATFAADTLRLDRSASVASMLPGDADEGLFMQVLYGGANHAGTYFAHAVAQNALLDALSAIQQPPFSAEGRIYGIRSDELVTLDVAPEQLFREVAMTAGLLSAADEPTIDPNDLALLEQLVLMRIGAVGASRLPGKLPPFTYGGQTSALGAFVTEIEKRTRCPIGLPPALALTRLRQLCADARARDGLFSYLLLLSILAHQRIAALPDNGFENGKSIYDLPTAAAALSIQQREAQHLLDLDRAAFAGCNLEHLPTLLALAWNGEVVAAASAPADDVVQKAIDDGIAAFDASEVLRAERRSLIVGLRVFALAHATSAADATPAFFECNALDSSVSTTTLVAPLMDAEGFEDSNALCAVTNANLRVLLESLERAWGPEVLDGAAVTNDADATDADATPLSVRLAEAFRTVANAPKAHASDDAHEERRRSAAVTPRWTPRSTPRTADGAPPVPQSARAAARPTISWGAAGRW